MMRITLRKQAQALLRSGLSVARVSLLTGISRDRVRNLRQGIIKQPYRKSYRKPVFIFDAFLLFTRLIRAGMPPDCAMQLCGRDMVMTAINYLFLYERRKRVANHEQYS